MNNRNKRTLCTTGHVKYRGYQIQRKRDFGSQGNWNKNGTPKGYVVTDGFCNVMPGATWSKTLFQAVKMIDDFITSEGDATKFWRLVQTRNARKKGAQL